MLQNVILCLVHAALLLKSIFLHAHIPYVFMEIDAQLGQLPACAQCFHIHVDYDYCKVHMSITVSVVYSQGSGLLFYIPVCSAVSILKECPHLYDCTLSTFCVLTRQC